MYLLIYNEFDGDLEIIRDLPDDIEDLDGFIIHDLKRPLYGISYIPIDEENTIIQYSTYIGNGKIKDDGYEYVGAKF